jgi:hypothetical protein
VPEDDKRTSTLAPSLPFSFFPFRGLLLRTKKKNDRAIVVWRRQCPRHCTDRSLLPPLPPLCDWCHLQGTSCTASSAARPRTTTRASSTSWKRVSSVAVTDHPIPRPLARESKHCGVTLTLVDDRFAATIAEFAPKDTRTPRRISPSRSPLSRAVPTGSPPLSKHTIGECLVAGTKKRFAKIKCTPLSFAFVAIFYLFCPAHSSLCTTHYRVPEPRELLPTLRRPDGPARARGHHPRRAPHGGVQPRRAVARPGRGCCCCVTPGVRHSSGHADSTSCHQLGAFDHTPY